MCESTESEDDTHSRESAGRTWGRDVCLGEQWISLWAGQMSLGNIITSGCICFTIRRFRYTQLVVSDPPMGSGRKTRRLVAAQGHMRCTIARVDYASRCESSGSAHCFIGAKNSASVEVIDSDDALQGQ